MDFLSRVMPCLADFMIIIKCKQCEKEFRTWPCKIIDNRGKFCSRHCKDIWQSTNLIGRNNPHWQGGNIEVKCKECGNNFKVIPATIKRNKGKFCSKKCLSRFQSVAFKGEKSAVWTGNTPYSILTRNSNRYTKWRMDIFKRDDFTCVICGKWRKGIQAHHVPKFSVLLKCENKLWDLNNGFTLCKECHKKEHTRRNIQNGK